MVWQTRHKILLVLVVVVFSALAIALLNGSKHQDTVKIGGLFAFTGSGAPYAQFNREGVDLALEEINGNDGINGRKLEIIYEDTQTRTQDALYAANKLIETDKVFAIIASADSPRVLAAAPIAEKNKVILLAAGVAAPQLTDAGDYIFRLKVASPPEMHWLAEKMRDFNKTTAATLFVLQEYGQGVSDSFSEKFEGLGGKILIKESFREDEKDFRTRLVKIKSLNPDVIVLGAYQQELAQIMINSKELGINSAFIAHGGSTGSVFFNAAKNSADGLLFGYEINEESPAFIEFRQKFFSRYSKEPDLFAAMGYDAVKLLAASIKICGESSECIKNELYKVQNYSGASGDISFDKNGDVSKPLTLMAVKNGTAAKYKS